MSPPTPATGTAIWLSMDKHLHIVSFNVPLPANYGGVIDVFYRLKSLFEAGLKIHLHCFTYGRPQVDELKKYCVEVFYYRRNMSPLLHFSRRPFIVCSRDNDNLRRRLMADKYPILLEGLHCCSLLEDENFLKDRIVMVRAHNVEANYYSRLAAGEHNPFRKVYLCLDAVKIRRYESILSRASAVFAISPNDKMAFERMGCPKVLLVSGSHPFNDVSSQSGLGTYALYHGNLAVTENRNAVDYLLDNVFFDEEYPLVIAGNHPSTRLKKKVEKMKNVTLVENPDDAQMNQLIADAQVNLLVTNQPTGLKIKLLNSLFAGRHCLVNSDMVRGTGLENLCKIADTPETLRECLHVLMQREFDVSQRQQREAVLASFTTSHAIQPILNLLDK